MRFDAKAAKLLKPGGHIVVDGVPGLRLVASTTGKSWTYRYKSDGLMRQIKMGQWPAMSLPEAIGRWQELKDGRAAGIDPAKEKKVARKVKEAVYTVRHAVEDYISGHLIVNRQADGVKAVSARLRTAIAEIADTPAASVTRRVAWDFITGLSGRPVLAKSVRNELGGAWDLALDAGKLSDDTPNWWRQILSGKLRSKGAVRDGVHKGTAKRVLSEAEVATLLTVDLARFSQQVQDFLVIQLWTCTRGSEIVQMHRAQITQETDGWWWTVPKVATKNKNRKEASDLRVPLVGQALGVVQRIESDLLFPSVSRSGVVGPQKQTYMQSKVNYLQPYCKQRPDHVRERLTVTHWSPHDLRRTGRTMLAQLGCPNEVAEAILGHVQPGIQGVYNLFGYDTERRQWLTAWSNYLDGLNPAPTHPSP